MQQQLMHAKALTADTVEVLEGMGLPTYDYNLFVYEQIWLKDRAAVGKVAKALRCLPESDLYDLAMAIHADNSTEREFSIRRLRARKLPFLMLYLAFCKEGKL